MLMSDNNGVYDIEAISSALERTLDEYGDFTVKVPGIKFISPEEKELNFGISDIRALRKYIAGGTL